VGPGGVLTAGHVIWVDVPDEGRHPAVVVMCLRTSYVIVNGSTAPQDFEPTLKLSEAAAKRCGLHRPSGPYRPTCFYCRKGWIWRLQPAVVPTHVGKLFGAYLSDLQREASVILSAMKLPVELPTIPPGLSISMPDFTALSVNLPGPKAE
jgi:hypothetical protein